MVKRANPNKARFNRPVTVDDVVDHLTLFNFAHQRVGTAHPTAKDAAAAGKIINDFLEQHPETTIKALTDVVKWAKAKKRHYGIVQLLGCWRYAQQDGYMTILERGSTNDADTLAVLLESVSDPSIRNRLIAAPTAAARDELFAAYMEATEGGEAPTEAQELSHGLSVGQVVKVQFSLADQPRFGSVLDTADGKVLVHTEGERRSVHPRLIQVKDGESWTPLQA
jgi:hypothetical protein